VLNQAMAAMAVQTGKGLDIVHAARPFAFPLESADYLMHFTWPSLSYTDDRGTAHAVKPGEKPAGVVNTGLFTALAGILDYWSAPSAAVFHRYATNVRQATKDGAIEPWEAFVFWDPEGATKPVESLPLSYFAKGLNHVATRSAWTRDATWLSFVAGAYINNPAQGEQMFDEGSLAIVNGGTPVLVNAASWLLHNTPGTSDGEINEKDVYHANYGKFDQNPAYGNRDLYSIFYAKPVVAEPYGQGALGPAEVRTRIAEFEDTGVYMYAAAIHLEDMYRATERSKPVRQWTREILFLRPNRIVIYDRTESEPGADSFLAWTFASEPRSVQNRIVVPGATMTTVLPERARFASRDLYNAHKVWREEVRAPDVVPTQTWLTLFETSPQPSSASPIGHNGVLLRPGEIAVVIGVSAYDLPSGPSDNLVLHLEPNGHYDVTVRREGETSHVAVHSGEALQASPAGILSFRITASGKVKSTT
jgi:hypothetical protein